MVLDSGRPGEDLVEIGDKDISLPHLWAHFAELAEKFGAYQVGRAAAGRVRLRLGIRPHDCPATALPAWVDAHVDAIRVVPQNQILTAVLGEGRGRQQKAGRSRGRSSDSEEIAHVPPYLASRQRERAPFDMTSESSGVGTLVRTPEESG